MKNYNDEATKYQNSGDGATQFDETVFTRTNKETSTSANKSKTAKGSTLKSAAIGAGTGLLIGGVSSFLVAMKLEPEIQTDEQTTNNHRDELSHPEWVDDQVPIATSVNDDMSFGEAFAAARAEVGPGGAFEWHGQLYGTYTAEEWSGMTAEQRAEYSDHFSWNHIDHSQSDVAQHSTEAQATSSETAQDEVEVVSVNHPEDHTAQQVSAEAEGQTVDNQDVILIDANNDQAYDAVAGDANNNNHIEQNETANIQEQDSTVDDLEGFSDPTDNYANDGGSDYSDNSVYEG
jgi:hypothetical protein